MERKRTIDARWAASERMPSRSGTGVRPSMRLMTSVWLTPGRVYSAPTAAAAAQKELTPGTTSKGMPRTRRASICSRIAP